MADVIAWDDWKEKGKELFGSDPRDWRFKCPRCKVVQSIQDFLDAGVEKDRAHASIYQECIGRYSKEKGCNWAVYGPFDICKVYVDQGGKIIKVFEFAGEPENDLEDRGTELSKNLDDNTK